MAITIYEINIYKGYHQEPTYQAMIDYCNNNNLDVNDIVEKTVDEPDERQKWFKISDFTIPELEGLELQYEPPVLSPDDLAKIDYDLRGYHKKRTFNIGELRVIEYYRNFDIFTDTYSDLIIREERKYLRDTNTGLAYAREMNIHWYLNTDEVGYSILNRMKYYSMAESMQEVRDRRTNLFTDAEKYILFELSQIYTSNEVMQKAVYLKASLQNEKYMYIEGVAEPLIAFLAQENNVINEVFTDSNKATEVKQVLSSILIYDFTAQVN